VHGEPGWHPQQLLVEGAQRLVRHGSARLLAGARVDLELAGVRPLRHRLPQLGVRVGELLVGLGCERLRFLLGDEALADQLLRVDLPHRRMLLDLVVHERLRVAGLVGLVVAEAAVADQVDHRVAAELPPESHRQLDGVDACLHVVGVHMDDGQVVALREV
jgi:hypothetical protein